MPDKSAPELDASNSGAAPAKTGKALSSASRKARRGAGKRLYDSYATWRGGHKLERSPWRGAKTTTLNEGVKTLKKHRILSLLLAAIMLIPANVTALAYDRTSKEPPSSTERVEQLRNSGLESLESSDPIDPLEEITAIVTLETQPVVAESSAGGRQVRNRAVMLRQQTAVQKKISSQVLDGEPVEVLHTYTAAANGFAIKVAYGKLDEIRALPGVASAYPAPEFKVAPDMESATTELGGLENSSGYQGEGMVIAILDTGLEISHKSFQNDPTDPALTQTDIEKVLKDNNLRAETKKAGITASQVYHTAKVPFAFDYADNDLDMNPGSAGDHGIHVSGIAAANAGVVSDVVGTAPQAQILAMKVFSSSGSNGATWADILAAADDAVTLGADVINMSLGSTCGFSTPEGDEEVVRVFQNIADSGVLLSISAGNEYSAALGTRIGKGHALTSNPDYGTVASPSSYSGPLSVASMEKADAIDSCYLTVGDRRVAFNDTAEDTTASGVDENSKSFRSLAGTELSYVVVPNAGEAKDYDGLDVKGKIVLVSRGSVEYNVKKEAAKNAGAAGILVYNNEPGMLYMQLDKYDLPSAFISQADGKALAALEEDSRKLTVSAAYGKVDNPTSGEMSDFSSWGVTPELTLKPDITAPGGNIKSATFNNGYTTKSGTSMAAPYVSGAMAVVKQYVEQQNYANSETDKAELVSDLLMSTADLVMAGAAPYSPRKQGAGSVNIAAATAAKVYLTAEDGTRPKVDLGDDPSKSGAYTVTFKLHNLSGETLTYTLGGYIQTDGQEVTKQIGGEDVHQVTELPYLLGKIETRTVTVPSKGTVTVTVPVGLTEANKAYLDANFKNGTYVEGFVTLTPESSAQPTLSIPYMGFYGDWTQAPIIDATDYGDVLNGVDSWSQAYTNTAASSSLEGTVNTYLGDNPYHSGAAYLSDRNAISPNDDDYMDSLSFVYTGLLRNVKSLTYEIKDAATGEVYYSKDMEYETTGGCTVLIDDVKLTAVGGGETPTPPAETFTITASAGQGGSITPSGAVSVEKNGSQTFTITPSANYKIEDVKVDNESQGAVDTYTFENVTETHTITASFTEKAVTLPDSIPEDFNNSDELPAGWTVEGPSANYNYESWKIARYQDWRSNAAVCAANYMGSTAQNELLILPEINMQDSMQMSFAFAASYAQLSAGTLRLTVKASLDKGQTWTEIWNAKDHMGEIDEEDTPEDVTGTGSISIPANYCKAGARFAFVFESGAKTGASAAIDNVAFTAGETPAPTERYGITIAEMVNGTVTADKSTAEAGDTVTLTVTPDTGYQLKAGSLMANDQVLSASTFVMPAKEVTVTALFEKQAEIPETGSYKDGVYTGAAQGFGGTVTVTVTVENGKIASVTASGEKETPSKWENALAMIEKLLGIGSDAALEKVDAVSGATVSSDAIREAVRNALKNAAQEDSGIFDGGIGTKQSPYLISTIDTLMKFAESVNDGEDYDGKYVALACDLDISGETWTPIGRVDHGKTYGFAGTFDGRNNTVSDVTCGAGGDAVDYEAIGFFGVVDAGGKVQNLNIQISKFYNDCDTGSGTVAMGGLAGILGRNAVIDHCSVSGGSQVLSETSGPNAAVGGLVGEMEFGSLVANSWTDVGLNYGSLYDDADVSMGGICGKQGRNSLIANSASFGSVPGMIMNGQLRTGGLVGQTSGALYNCYTDSLTKANVMGSFDGTTIVAGEASTAVGFLAGSSTNDAALYQCYYDKSADQFSNSDLAADPEEGKTERRKATGWDNGSETRIDESFLYGMSASQLTSDEFADELNSNQKNSVKKQADSYFAAYSLLDSQVADLEDDLEDGFRSWTLTDGRVLFGDEAVERVTVTFVELLEQQTVPVGTAETALNLPETVEVTLSDRTKETLGVAWKCDSYNGNTPGSYTFEGTLALTGGITNPKSLKAYVVVVVEDGGQPVTKYQVTVSGGSGSGSYTPGETVTIKANTPASGCAFNGWTATGVTLADASAGTTTFVMPGHNVRIAANWKSTGSGGGGSSGVSSSGGSTVSGATYPISLPGFTANGTVTVSPADAAKGSRVTITATPASGYVLDKLMVTDASGNLLGLTNQGGGKFTFTMPGSAVTVQAAFGKESGGVFADVPNSAYYADAVKWAVAQGITNGKGSGLFGSNEACTRAQIVTFLWRAAGSPAPKMTFNPFSDVSPDAYYYQAVLWAVENGITGGMGNGRFSPEGTCTRGQSVTFLYRAAGAPAVSGSSFQDMPASSYCADAIAWAVKNGITQGNGAGGFSPNGGCTRAQIVTFLYRQYK